MVTHFVKPATRKAKIMTTIELEHINFTVKDARKTAQEFCDIFGWEVRWHGDAMDGQGETWHVGSNNSYLAIYSPKEQTSAGSGSSYTTQNGLNHIGVTVPDIDAMKERVKEAGYIPGPQWDYEPGRRFYFHNHDGIEVEVVSYN
ncbi:MAG: VOC family protein [Rhizobiaceae bacterium]